MKKPVINLIVGSMMCVAVGCGDGKSNTESVTATQTSAAEAPAPSTTESSTAPAASSEVVAQSTQEPETFGPVDAIKGKSKVENSDCKSCHALNEKKIGPAFEDIAFEYDNNEKNLNYLADKIIAGGKGVWGDYPMAPHAGLSKADARDMAAYILTLAD
jgi:cytochrome c